jgi:hypothetical protein
MMIDRLVLHAEILAPEGRLLPPAVGGVEEQQRPLASGFCIQGIGCRSRATLSPGGRAVGLARAHHLARRSSGPTMCPKLPGGSCETSCVAWAPYQTTTSAPSIDSLLTKLPMLAS